MVEIRPVSYADILDAPNAEELIRSYASECSVPNAEPQPEIYAAMESAGALKCFGAYVDDRLVGFVSVLTAIVPHDGHRVAVQESLFVSPAYRRTGAGQKLLEAAKKYAVELDCMAFQSSARIGSRLDKVLSREANCQLTHHMYTFWLQGQ